MRTLLPERARGRDDPWRVHLTLMLLTRVVRRAVQGDPPAQPQGLAEGPGRVAQFSGESG